MSAPRNPSWFCVIRLRLRGPLSRALFALLLALTASAADNSVRAIQELERAVAAQPDNGSAIRALAHAYALALLQTDQDAVRYATAALDTSRNVWILSNAANRLQSEHNAMLQFGVRNEHAASLAARYFLQAQRLDPNLDRNTILPHLDLAQLARARQDSGKERQESARRFDEAAKHIRRLEPSAFPGLPTGIVAALRARRCTVPQPFGATRPRNVIHGEFFAPGQDSWAVLCSVNGWSSILVFRTAQDANPHSLARSEDRNYLQGIDQQSIGYSRQIQTVGRDFILSHDRGHSGPKPRQLTHHGIDDAFLEKASVTLYFDAGKWFNLPGAD